MALKLYNVTQVTVATAGTQVQVSTSNLPITTIVISAPAANTGVIYVGNSDVSATTGIEVAKGTSVSITADMSGRAGGEEFILSDFWIDAATDGDKANVLYITRR